MKRALLFVMVAALLLGLLDNAYAAVPTSDPATWGHFNPHPYWPTPYGRRNRLPFQFCDKDSDCCGVQECRTYSGFPSLGIYPGGGGSSPTDPTKVTPVGAKRCIPKSFNHTTPSSDEVFIAGDIKTNIWGFAVKAPLGMTCNPGKNWDWHVQSFCCIVDWVADLFVPDASGAPTWQTKVTRAAMERCTGVPSYLRNTDYCCGSPGPDNWQCGSAQDKYMDPVLKTRCLIGSIQYSPANGTNTAAWGPVLYPCCADTCRYHVPAMVDPGSTLWLCLAKADLGWDPVSGKRPGACDLQAKAMDGSDMFICGSG